MEPNYLLQKGCTRLAAASDKVYQLLVHGRWFSLGTPASSTTKTGRHDIAESGVRHQQSINESITKLFNYKNVLQVLYIVDFKSKRPDCTCTSSHLYIILLASLLLVTLRDVLDKEQKYLEPTSIN